MSPAAAAAPQQPEATRHPHDDIDLINTSMESPNNHARNTSSSTTIPTTTGNQIPTGGGNFSSASTTTTTLTTTTSENPLLYQIQSYDAQESIIMTSVLLDKIEYLCDVGLFGKCREWMGCIIMGKWPSITADSDAADTTTPSVPLPNSLLYIISLLLYLFVKLPLRILAWWTHWETEAHLLPLDPVNHIQWNLAKWVPAVVGQRDDGQQQQDCLFVMTPKHLEMRSSADLYARTAWKVQLLGNSKLDDSHQQKSSISEYPDATTLSQLACPTSFQWIFTCSSKHLFLSNQHSIQIFDVLTGKNITTWHHKALFDSSSYPESNVFILQMHFVHNHLLLLLNDMHLYLLDVSRMMDKAKNVTSSLSNSEAHLFLLDPACTEKSSASPGAVPDQVLSFHVDNLKNDLFYIPVPKKADSTLLTICKAPLPASASQWNKSVIPSFSQEHHKPVLEIPSARLANSSSSSAGSSMYTAAHNFSQNSHYIAHMNSQSKLLSVYRKSDLSFVSTFPFKDVISFSWFSKEKIILSRSQNSQVSVYDIFSHEQLISPPEKFDGTVKLTDADNGKFFILEQMMHYENTEQEQATKSNEEKKASGLLCQFKSDVRNRLDKLLPSEIATDTNEQAPPTYTLMYNLFSFDQESPLTYYEYYLSNQDFDAALSIAEQYDLDADVVYKRKWKDLASHHGDFCVVHESLISSVLVKIQDHKWALAQCLNSFGNTEIATIELLEYAQLLNARMLLDAIGVDSKQYSHKSSLERLTSHFKSTETSLPDDEILLLQMRVHILKCMDRLKTLTQYMKYYDWKRFRQFALSDISEYTTQQAKNGRIEFVRQIVAHHDKELNDTQKLQILSALPMRSFNFEDVNYRNTFAILLPSVVSNKQLQVHWDYEREPWRERDFSEDLLENMSRESQSAELTVSMLSDWVLERISELDEAYQHEAARELCQLAMDKNIPSMEALNEELSLLCLLEATKDESRKISSAELAALTRQKLDLRLDTIREMKSEQLLSKILEQATEDNVVERFETVVLPYIAQTEKSHSKKHSASKHSWRNHLLHYLIVDYLSIYRDDFNLVEKIVEQSVQSLTDNYYSKMGDDSPLNQSAENHRTPIISDGKILQEIVSRCIYESPSIMFSDHKRVQKIIQSFRMLPPPVARDIAEENVEEVLSDAHRAMMLSTYDVDYPFSLFRKTSEEQHQACLEILSELLRYGLSQGLSQEKCSALWQNLDDLHNSWKAFSESVNRVDMYEQFLQMCLRLGHVQYCADRALQDGILSIHTTSALMYDVMEDMLQMLENVQEGQQAASPSRRRSAFAPLLSIVLLGADEYQSLLSSISALFNSFDSKIASKLDPESQELQRWQREKKLFRAFVTMSEHFKNHLSLGEIRSEGLQIELIQQIVSMNTVHAEQIPILFEIASQLGVDSVHHRNQITLYLGEKALIESNYENALDICITIMNDNFADGWKICSRVARGAPNLSPQQKDRLLAFAIEHCPSESETASLIQLYRESELSQGISAHNLPTDTSFYSDSSASKILNTFYNSSSTAGSDALNSHPDLSYAIPSELSDLKTQIQMAYYNQDYLNFIALLTSLKESDEENSSEAVKLILDELVEAASAEKTDASLKVLRMGSYFFARCLTNSPQSDSLDMPQLLEHVDDLISQNDTDSQNIWRTFLAEYSEKIKLLSHTRQVELQASELSSSLDVRRFLSDESYRTDCIEDFACTNDERGAQLFNSSLVLASKNGIALDNLLATYLGAQFTSDNESSMEEIQEKISNIFSEDRWEEYSSSLLVELQHVIDEVIAGEQLVLFEYALSLKHKLESQDENLAKERKRTEDLLNVVRALIEEEITIDFRELFLLSKQEQVLNLLRPFISVHNEEKLMGILGALSLVSVEENAVHAMLFDKLLNSVPFDSADTDVSDIEILLKRVASSSKLLGKQMAPQLLEHSTMHNTIKERLLEQIIDLLSNGESKQMEWHVRMLLFNAKCAHQINDNEDLHKYRDLWSDLLHNSSTVIESALLDMMHSGGGITLSAFESGLSIMKSNFDTILQDHVPDAQVKHQKKISGVQLHELINAMVEVLLAYIDDFVDPEEENSLWNGEFDVSEVSHSVPLIISAPWPPTDPQELISHLKCLLFILHESKQTSLEDEVHEQLKDFASSEDCSVKARLFVLNAMKPYRDQHIQLEELQTGESQINSPEENLPADQTESEGTTEKSGDDSDLLHQIKTKQYMEKAFEGQEAPPSSLNTLTPHSPDWNSEFENLLGMEKASPQIYDLISSVLSEWNVDAKYHSALCTNVEMALNHLLGSEAISGLKAKSDALNHRLVCGLQLMEKHADLVSSSVSRDLYTQLSKKHMLYACKIAILSSDTSLQEECIDYLDNSRNAKRLLRESKGDDQYGDLLSLCVQKGYATSIVKNAELCKQLLQGRVSMSREKEATFVANLCTSSSKKSAGSDAMILLSFAAEYVSSKCVYNIPRSMNTFSNALSMMYNYLSQQQNESLKEAREFLASLLQR